MLHSSSINGKPFEARGKISLNHILGNGESILVVDDVQELRYVTSTILAKLNYTVTTAPSGEYAVKYIQHCIFDLVILDMIMDPGIDGLETYRQILENRPMQKAIFASGLPETSRVVEMQRLGAGIYIRKPYTIEEIGVAVKKALENK